MIRPLALSCAALLGLAQPGLAMERTLTLPAPVQDITATLETPEETTGSLPAVLLLHGFTGTRDELAIPGTDEGVFARSARLMAEAGLASLRIDFRGSGDSVGAMTYADTTFEGQIEDAQTALTWLRQEGFAPIYLLGWSQGGLVATGAAGRSEGVAAVALWNAVADPLPTYTGLLGQTMFNTASAAEDPNAPVTTALPWGAEVALKPAFFEGVRSYDPLAEIAAYPGPLLVAQGSQDTLVAPASADRLLEAHDGPEAKYTDEMDHSFNIFTETEALDALIARTIAFFAEN